MKLTSLATLLFIVLFSACSSGGGKKLAIMSSGKISVSGSDNKTINFEPGGQHNEMELNFTGSDKVTITVNSGGVGNGKYDMTDDGVYLLSLKTDTMIGDRVNYGSTGRPASISSQQLQHMIDSTQDLLVGKNADNKNTFFVLPYSIKKISSNKDATVLSPFKNIQYQVEVDKNGNPPETYKFFTNSQKREDLAKLIKRMSK